MFSVQSDALGGPRAGGPQTAQVSTTTLLNAVHNIYLASQPHKLDASTSLVVNTWLTAAQGVPAVDGTLSARAWEHSRRRAEDGCIILGYVFAILVDMLNGFTNVVQFSPSIRPIRPRSFLEYLPFCNSIIRIQVLGSH